MTTPRTLAARVALCLLVVGGCKRSRAPKVEEVWDEDPTSVHEQGVAGLAPAWPAPVRGLLPNGLLTFWLHEPDAAATHIRILLPTRTGDALPPAAIAVATEHLRVSLSRRVTRLGATVTARSGPGRLEFGIHGRTASAAAMLDAVSRVLSSDNTGSLERARRRVSGRVTEPSADEHAAAYLVSSLLRVGPGTELVAKSDVQRLSRSKLLRGWETVTDPRRAVMVVHTGLPAADGKDGLRRLADVWVGRGRLDVQSSAVARLHTRARRKPSNRVALGQPPLPLQVVPGPAVGRPVVWLGRAVPLRNAKQRSLARLAQRVLQEELDARLLIAGNVGVFVIRVPLRGGQPEASLQRALEQLTNLSKTRHQKQRLFQAAQLWLGARVVQASLSGEDWTALWADAIDLAHDDPSIASALHRDAAAMLEPQPEALQRFQAAWLDPRAGKPGWRWAVAGADPRTLRRLARITPVRGPQS